MRIVTQIKKQNGLYYVERTTYKYWFWKIETKYLVDASAVRDVPCTKFYHGFPYYFSSLQEAENTYIEYVKSEKIDIVKKMVYNEF